MVRREKPFQRPWMAKKPGQIKRTFFSIGGRAVICAYVKLTGVTSFPVISRRHVARSRTRSVGPMVSNCSRGVRVRFDASRLAGFSLISVRRSVPAGSTLRVAAHSCCTHDESVRRVLPPRTPVKTSLVKSLRVCMTDPLAMEYISSGVGLVACFSIAAHASHLFRRPDGLRLRCLDCATHRKYSPALFWIVSLCPRGIRADQGLTGSLCRLTLFDRGFTLATADRGD